MAQRNVKPYPGQKSHAEQLQEDLDRLNAIFKGFTGPLKKPVSPDEERVRRQLANDGFGRGYGGLPPGRARFAPYI